MNQKTIGILAIFFAGFFWAIETVFIKLAFGGGADFLGVAFLRGIFAGVLAFLFVLFAKKSLNAFIVTRKQFSAVLYIAIAASLVADVLFMYALNFVPIVNANLIAHMQPAFIILLGFFLLKEDKLTKREYFGIFVLLLAGLFVSTQTIENFFSLKFGTFGDFLILLCAIVWSTTVITAKKYLKDLNVGVLIFYRMFLSSIAFVIYYFISGQFFFSNIFQILVGVSAGAGFIFYYSGLMRLKAGEASALELSAPFFAAILGFFILGEQIYVLQILGIVLLVVGVYLLSRKN